MRSLVLFIVLLIGSPTFGQQPKAITNSIGMKLVLIHPGSFTMGSPMEEQDRLADMTSHEVTISKSYYLGMYEVTQEQYEKVMENNPSGFAGATNPVEGVSWDDAISFCKKLSELPEEKAVRRDYRLPKEAEWEYACRATCSAAYCFGDSAESLGEYAWFGEVFGSTHPVGQKKPNRWGLYDMHGNVWEWCQDWYADQSPSADAINPPGPSGGSYRVIRGGSWSYAAYHCRSANRKPRDPPNREKGYIGFRVALSPSVK